MCRLAAYVGRAPVTLSSLLYDPPHSLEHAAHSPKELLAGTVNVDGTGVAWWEDGQADPMRYVTAQPPWSDPNLPDLSRRLRGSTILAAVRSATPGIPFGPANVAPFVVDGMAGVHNGWIGGFRSGLGRVMLQQLSDARFGQLAAMNDSLALFLMVAQAMEDDPGASIAEGVTRVIERVAKEVVRVGEQATLNLVVAGAGEVVAARTSAGFDVNSLYVCETGDSVRLASEPLDHSEDWKTVPEHSLVRISAGELTVQSLTHDGTGR